MALVLTHGGLGRWFSIFFHLQIPKISNEGADPFGNLLSVHIVEFCSHSFQSKSFVDPLDIVPQTHGSVHHRLRITGLGDGVSLVQNKEGREGTKRCAVGSSHQSPVLQVLSQKAVIIQGIFGFSCYPVHWSLIYLVLNSTEEHIQRLADRVLAEIERGSTLERSHFHSA